MTVPQNQFWHLKPGVNAEQLLAKLGEKFSIETEDLFTHSVSILDDPDSAIWTAGHLLVKTAKNAWWLYHADGIDKANKVPAKARFWWDLPESSLRSKLGKLVDLRAILPVENVTISEQAFVIRNEDEKIVVRGNLSTVCHSDDRSEDQPDLQNDLENDSCLFVELRSLRGYDKDFEQAAELLKEIQAEEIAALSMQAMVKHCGIGPEEKETKSDFGIYGEEPVELAVRQMSSQMLRVARDNEQGVIDDIDTEFLHQYRVSLRKTRSLINLMKKAFPIGTHSRLKELLGQLAGCTNQLRDMDVFLLGRDHYAQMLPKNFDEGFGKLYQLIGLDREKARKTVNSQFKSTDHDKAFKEVFSILEKDPVYENAFASQPVLEAAKKKIIKRYHRIVALGIEIDDNTPDEEVHQLRIECKKLRYMMEFFAELFPKKTIKELIKTLKKLQTILGNFNDYSVQKEFLADYEKSHKKSAALSAAINGLIAVLHQKQLFERTKVQKAFADFNDDAVKQKFAELFAGQQEAEQ